MGARVWGEPFYTSHFSGSPVFYQPVVPGNDGENFVLKGVKTSVIMYNNPTITSLEMRIYSNQSGPSKLLYTSSNVQLKSSITTLANAIKEIYFDFDMLPNFDKDDTYNFVLWANSYTGDSSSHVAWKKAVPDSAYEPFTNLIKIGVWPYDIHFIGADL